MAKFKEGDWVVYEFKIGQIVDKHEFTDGYIRHCGNRIADCYALTLATKCICDEFVRIKSQITNHTGLNWPDIQRELVRMFNSACELTETETLEKEDLRLIHGLQEIYKDAQRFVKEINEAFSCRCNTDEP